ncbi:MAG: phage-like element protein XkdS, partial [Anaerocolumna sp.]|nr:phage-like element protein XkdS [Anaerocolumna sp.]
IYNVLGTEQYEYPIYSFDYGISLENLIGKDLAYISIEIERRITECLMEDERIISVDQFTYDTSGDELRCSFTVKTIYGEIDVVKEVNY